jgi:hypothetical protein
MRFALSRFREFPFEKLAQESAIFMRATSGANHPAI